jgi:hypothetical protein
MLLLNPWLFNSTWNIFAYYDKETKIPKDVFEIEKNWITDNFILFSGMVNSLKDYIDKVNWEDYGTWYIYQFPSEISSLPPVIIGRDQFLDTKQRYTSEAFMEMPKDWEFIHGVKPDMFISKLKNGIMVGSINELNLMEIDSNMNK